LGDLLAIKQTQLDLALMLLQGIRGALANQHFQMNPNNREPSFRTLVNAQNKIGWHHVLKGRLKKHWTQIQGRHIMDDPELDHEKQSGERWLKLALHW
jgi:hypothetical protein